MNEAEELLDLVDANDQIVQKGVSRKVIYDQDLWSGPTYIRVVEIFIRRGDGKLWIPTRRTDKRVAPGGFDVGVGGHIESGETAEQAARKEILEEAGWNYDELDARYIGRYLPSDGLLTVSYVFEITALQAPKLNRDDFTSDQWLSPAELYELIKNGHPAKSNLARLLELVYSV